MSEAAVLRHEGLDETRQFRPVAVNMDEEQADVTTKPTTVLHADATKLNFPLQLVAAIVISTLTGVGAVWATQAKSDGAIRDVQADVRVMLSQQSSATEITRLRDEATRAQLDNLREELKAVKANSQLFQLQLQQVQLELAKGKR